jgi:hypothetical protein
MLWLREEAATSNVLLAMDNTGDVRLRHGNSWPSCRAEQEASSPLTWRSRSDTSREELGRSLPQSTGMMGLIAIAGVMTAGVMVWRVTQRLSWQDLLMVTRATGSARACVGYVLFRLRGED